MTQRQAVSAGPGETVTATYVCTAGTVDSPGDVFFPACTWGALPRAGRTRFSACHSDLHNPWRRCWAQAQNRALSKQFLPWHWISPGSLKGWIVGFHHSHVLEVERPWIPCCDSSHSWVFWVARPGLTPRTPLHITFWLCSPWLNTSRFLNWNFLLTVSCYSPGSRW